MLQSNQSNQKGPKFTASGRQREMSSKTLMIKIIIILHDVSSQNINKHRGGREIVRQEKKNAENGESSERGEFGEVPTDGVPRLPHGLLAFGL